MWLQIMWLLIFTLWHNKKVIRRYETQTHTFTLKANRTWNVKRKNIHIHLSWHSLNKAYYFLIILTFNFVFVFCFNLFFLYFFYFVFVFLQSSSWPCYGYTFDSHIYFTLFFFINYLYYLFIHHGYLLPAY